MPVGTPATVIDSSLTGSQNPQWLKEWRPLFMALCEGNQVQIQGHYELQFEAVREAFAALFDDPQERVPGCASR